MSEHIPFEEPPAKAIRIKVDGQNVVLRKGKTVVAMFWERPEVNYVGVEEEDGEHMVIFNEDFAAWVGGIALTEYTAELKRNHDRDSFKDLYGWRPRLVIDEYPGEEEIDIWIQHRTQDLDIPGAWEEDDDDE